MLNNIKAVIFDFDGTLLDSENFHFETANQVLTPFNVQLTRKYYNDHLAGVPTKYGTPRIVEDYGLGLSWEELKDLFENATIERMDRESIPLTHFAKESIEFFHGLDLPMAIVTGSPKRDVVHNFVRYDLLDYFQTIIGRDEVLNGKPHPEPYERCVDFFGFEKGDFLVFEDTENGLKSAKAAGLTCFAVQQNVDEHHKLHLADQLFLNLEEALSFLQNGISSLE